MTNTENEDLYALPKQEELEIIQGYETNNRISGKAKLKIGTGVIDGRRIKIMRYWLMSKYGTVSTPENGFQTRKEAEDKRLEALSRKQSCGIKNQYFEHELWIEESETKPRSYCGPDGWLFDHVGLNCKIGCKCHKCISQDAHIKEIFDYSPHFEKEKKAMYNGQKVLLFLEEIVKLTEQERLSRNKDKVFKKLFEEIGEYAVSSLGDKPVTESPRQEMCDVLIMTLSLFILEGGSLEFLSSYGMEKINKWKQKIEKGI